MLKPTRKVPLNRAIVEYAFLDIYGASQDPKKKVLLKKNLINSGCIITARKIRQQLKAMDKEDLTKIRNYLSNTLRSSESAMITKVILLTLDVFHDVLIRYCAEYKGRFTSSEITEIIQREDINVSLRIAEARRKRKDGVLIELNNDKAIYLNFETDPHDKRRYYYRATIEHKLNRNKEHIYSIHIVIPKAFMLGDIIQSRALSKVRDKIEAFNPNIYISQGASYSLIDIFIGRETSTTQSRYFVEDDMVVELFFERELKREEGRAILDK